MKKLVPLLILLGMILLSIVSWNNILTYNKKGEQQYQRHLKLAQENLDKKILVDAASEYKKALQMKPNNYELAMQIVDIYDQLGDKDLYISALNGAIKADKTQIQPYLIQADYYIEKKDYKHAYNILVTAEKEIDSDEIESRLVKLRQNYTLRTAAFAEVLPFNFEKKDSSNGYAVVRDEDGKAGLINETNSVYIDCKYDEIGFIGEDLIPVKFEGEWYYMLKSGFRKKVPARSADFLGSFTEGYAPASLEGMYGYLNSSMKEFHFEYEYAGGFAQSIAAVKKDGKWYIIDKSFKQLEGLEFEDVLLDDYGYCSKYGVFFAKKDGKWSLYSKSGQVLSEGWDEAKCFVSEEPAAVKKDGKWGFVTIAGESILETKYEDVQSFCCGYAPFLEKGKWGCIDKSGNVLFEPSFLNMKAFARNGYALTESEDGKKKFVAVKLYK